MNQICEKLTTVLAESALYTLILAYMIPDDAYHPASSFWCTTINKLFVDSRSRETSFLPE